MDIISVVQDFFASQEGQFSILAGILFLYSSLKVFILRNSVTSGVEVLAIASIGLEALILPAIVGTLAHFGPEFTFRANPGLILMAFCALSLISVGILFGHNEANWFKNTVRFFSYSAIFMAILYAYFEFGPSYNDCEPIRSANLMVDFLDPNHSNGLKSALLKTDPNLRWLEWVCSY
jgi:hypothetical protein